MKQPPHNTTSPRLEANICKLWEDYEAINPEYDLITLVCYARPRDGRTLEDPTGIPETFYQADIHDFKFDLYRDQSRAQGLKDLASGFFEKYKVWEENGKWLYLWSYKPGSGKTFLNCCLANSVRIKYNLQCRFISAVDYLSAVGEGYDKERGEVDPSAKYRECELLVLDDLGAHKCGEWQQQEIFRLLDTRMKNSLTTIISSNLPLTDLKIGERTINRVFSKCITFHLPEESIRTKIAEEENTDFLKKILPSQEKY